MTYVWKYFNDLSSKRLNTGYGFLPLQYSEIKAYFELYDINYSPIEIYLIEVLDSITMQHYADEAAKEKENKAKK